MKLVLTPLGKVLKKTLFAINAIFTLIANRVIFKTLPRSVKTSFMTKGHGQGVINAKITDPKYLCLGLQSIEGRGLNLFALFRRDLI